MSTENKTWSADISSSAGWFIFEPFEESPQPALSTVNQEDGAIEDLGAELHR